MSSAPQTIASVPAAPSKAGASGSAFGRPAGQAVLHDLQVDVLAPQLAAQFRRADRIQSDDINQQNVVDPRKLIAEILGHQFFNKLAHNGFRPAHGPQVTVYGSRSTAWAAKCFRASHVSLGRNVHTRTHRGANCDRS